MGISIGNVTGNIQNNEQGSGIQINSIINGNIDDSEIATKFIKKYGNECTQKERAVIVGILNELDKQAKENPAKLKETGIKPWWKKIQTALSSVANIATISSAPWWDCLFKIITDFVSNINA